MTPKETLDRLDRIFIWDLELKVELSKALKKQIPKKPTLADEQAVRYVTTYVCPACGLKLTGTGIASYCYHCGQKLDWSDKNA